MNPSPATWKTGGASRRTPRLATDLVSDRLSVSIRGTRCMQGADSSRETLDQANPCGSQGRGISSKVSHPGNKRGAPAPAPATRSSHRKTTAPVRWPFLQRPRRPIPPHYRPPNLPPLAGSATSTPRTAVLHGPECAERSRIHSATTSAKSSPHLFPIAVEQPVGLQLPR